MHMDAKSFFEIGNTKLKPYERADKKWTYLWMVASGIAACRRRSAYNAPHLRTARRRERSRGRPGTHHRHRWKKFSDKEHLLIFDG